MHWFRNASVRTKLTLLMVLVVSIVVILLCLVLMINDVLVSRDTLVDHLSVLAEVLGANSTVALQFDDPNTGADVLSSLHEEPAVLFACTYDREGRPFARYPRDTDGNESPAAPNLARISVVDGEAVYFEADYLHVYQEIQQDGETIGTIYLRGSVAELRQRMIQNAILLSCLLLASLVLVFMLAALVQRVVSRPIQNLARATQKVTETNDYSIRVKAPSRDELGTLCDGFNEMLGQIEKRDAELEQHRHHLEELVESRTHDVRNRTNQLARANEELKRSNRDLDDFAYIASHDLREPLRGISNYAVFLSEDYDDKLDDEGRAKLQTLQRLCQRMDAQIASLLHYSRVGRAELAVAETDLNALVDEVVDSLKISLDAANVEIRIPRPLPLITCDTVRVREVFHNLIGNAIKYNDKQEKWIEIGWETDHAGPASTESQSSPRRSEGSPILYVADNGIGIREKHLDSVFRIFKRLHGRDKYGGGTGAGLTFVKQIAERHGGRVWVESKVGKGSKFRFTLASDTHANGSNEATDSDR